MSKFKVGDIVRGISNIHAVTSTDMLEGRVLSVTKGFFDQEFISIKILKHKAPFYVGREYSGIHSHDVELVEPYQDWKVVIVPRGNKTVAKLYKNNAVVKTVECNKHPDDEYSMDEAIKVVTERLLEPEKPKYYNGKVVCIDNCRNHRNYTVGKIYQVKDGYFRNDHGIQLPIHPVTSFESFQRSSAAKWLEVVE